MDLKDDQTIQELSIATQLLWSSVDKIRDILGKKAVLTKTGDIDGDPCFLIALPRSRWQFSGKQPIPSELIQQEPETPGRVGNSPGDALAIPPETQEEPSQALAISEEEHK